jgi:excisionase family DNA binding protein
MTSSASLTVRSNRSGGSNPGQGHAGNPPELIGVEGLAAWLGVEIVFIRRLVAERRIPFVKIGKYVRFDPVEVAAWVDEQRVGVHRTRSGHRGRW